MHELTTLLLLLPVFTAGDMSGQPTVLSLSPNHRVHFLDRAMGQAAITEDRVDVFFRVLSRIDIEVRLAEPLSDVPPTQRLVRLKRLYRDAVLDWSTAEVRALGNTCQDVFLKAEQIAPGFIPRDWKFVLTDGSEEAGAAYTRNDAIVLSRGRIKQTDASRLARVVAHETSHVFSRSHPQVRDRLYARLGFRKVGPIDLGPTLTDRRLTNPDGPEHRHVIRVQTAALGAFDVVPVIYAKTGHYSPEEGRTLFQYLRFGLFPVEAANGHFRVRQLPARATLGFQVDEVTGFFEQVGRNTKYVIHPDEILAENIAILLTEGPQGGPSRTPQDQQLLRDLAAILQTLRINRA